MRPYYVSGDLLNVQQGLFHLNLHNNLNEVDNMIIYMLQIRKQAQRG